MDGVLEEAAVLCVCKVASSLVFLPSLAASYSPVSFCCCCLLVFTDVLVAVFLSFLCVSGSWLTEPTPAVDVVSLRFLIFLGRTYGAVLLLTTPLIAAETLTRLLRPRCGSDGHRCRVGVDAAAGGEDSDDDDDDNDDDKGQGSPRRAVGYLCCLSVWVAVALNVRWRWGREETWAAACLYATNSLIGCLPNLFSPTSIAVNPCWGVAFLSLLLLLVTASADPRRRRPDLARALRGPAGAGMPAPGAARCVDPGKTGSSCAVPAAFALVSPWRSAAERRTNECLPLTLTPEDVDARSGSRRVWRRGGSPCPGVNVLMGFVAVLSIFVLPLNLSVNILLIRTIETALVLCITSLVSSAANASPHNETLV
ncbi:uncharacterized protein LOC119194139 [Pungitius pungitius]|uniref:uncharacterized protein LOC119194139 n=1 Tax=Pungitius pungitius TaxID=134920 RepID=UPI002E1672BA